MVYKRKTQSGDDLDGDQSVPLPIQTFFWRQTSPFIRPKQSKLCEASCVSFERVVVQNILHGLSPSLCEAVQSVSRWKVVQAAFPHLMHACSSLVTACKQGNADKRFGPSETKLLYTLHWIILDAASECEDADSEKLSLRDRKHGSPHMHSLSTVQLFVYLFAPLIHLMKDSDFESLKLENGLRLWQPLWEYQQPDIPCFATPVKPQRSVLKAQRSQLKVNTNSANIYIGKGTSRENLAFLFDEPCSGPSPEELQPANAPLARMSDICTLSTAESQTATMELICESCNTVIPMKSSEAGIGCACGRKDNLVAFLPDSNNYAFLKLTSAVDKDYVKQKLASAVTSGTRAPGALDILSASYLDIAVLRCLFCLSWSEDGIYWALRYMHQRVLEVCQEFSSVDTKERSRSSSLPVPDLNILMAPLRPHGHAHHHHESHSGPSTPTGIVPEVQSPTMKHVPGLEQRRSAMTLGAGIPLPEVRKEPPFKKIRVVELKQFLDSGKSFLRKKDHSDHDGNHDNADLDGDSSRPTSALGHHHHYKEHEEDFGALISSGSCRKSMPTLVQGDKDSVGSSSQCSVQDSSTSSQAELQNRNLSGQSERDNVRKPIIKITEHSPESKGSHKAGSTFNLHPSEPMEDDTPPMPRSYTDSHIAYKQDGEIPEVAGSKYYIQDNGHLNYKVVLRALHFVAMNEHSPRICEVLLNLLNCLLDLDIVEAKVTNGNSPMSDVNHQTDDKTSTSGNNDSNATSTPKNPPSEDKEAAGKNEVTAHSLAMDSLFRIYKALGCPHGCGDGVMGPQGDHLRIKGQNCLYRLHKINPAFFHGFLRDTINKRPLQETVDFLHAFLGFCIDPVLLIQSPTSQKKSVSQENLPRSGYASNFGHSVGGEGYRGVEGVMLANLVKPLVSRCVECAHELYGSENISLFCDVRQLMAYTKEIHGGTFRRVALSGLLDSLQKVRKESAARKRELSLKKQPFPIKRTTSVTSESGDEKENNNVLQTKPVGLSSKNEENGTRRKSRKSLFRSKITKSLMFQYAASDSEILDEGPGKSPRTSISAAEEDSPNSSTIPRRRFSKFNIGWRRGTKSDHEDEQTSDPPPLDRRESRSEMQVHQVNPRPPRMSFKAASQATLTFLSARKRIEDGIKILGKRMSRKGSNEDFRNQRSGVNRDPSVEVALIKEKKMVDKYLVKSGMLRFSFLLECCNPGSLPDPQLVAAMLDLEAPVSARAALLLEVSHFIHRCNRGDWPSWMKLNIPSFRHTAAALQNRGQPSGFRRNAMLRRAAGRMFYSWAENLGLQLEYILAKEHADRLAVIDDVKDENRRKELRNEDEEEDFLDEASINSKGKECPYALKMLACLVLVEITTFLRETFQYLPKSMCQKREQAWEKNITSRRISSIVSSPGHSDKSSESNLTELPTGMSNIGSPGDRKISFAVLTERSDSLNSSTTSLSMIDPHACGEEKRERGRRIAQGRQKLLRHFRRGSAHNLSFRRSFKLMRGGGGGEGGGSIKQGGSIKSRKISSHSLQSDSAKFPEDEVQAEDTESVTMMSDDTQESPGEKDLELEDEHMYTNLPWIKVVVQLANLSNFICSHQNYCHPNCYERQRRSCSRLIAALRKIYDSTPEDGKDTERPSDGKKDTLKEKLKRRVTSPSQRRKESTPLLEKIKIDVSLTKLKLSSTWKKDDKPREAKEELPIIKYLTSQAQRLTQCPMAILTKAAPILNVEHFIDIMPVAWELMLESDQELAAAAASVFLLSSAKSSDKARNMIIKELQHEETSQRINALLRFQALWKFRYQVWPRMEEGANQYFKLPPPSIDFTLPSPTIGLPNLNVIDPPWMPHLKTKIEEVTANQEETKSLVTATTTRRKQQQEMIRRALLAEDERKRVGRENFPMTTVPISQLAAYEPSLHHGDQEHEEAMQEELSLAARRVSLAPTNRANNQSRSMSWRNGSLHWGKLASEGDDERLEHGQNLQLAQSVFPSCICAAVLPVLHLLDDHEVNTDGVSVSEVATKVIWECIVDDSILFLRHFLEKLTNKDRQEELMFLLRKLILYFPQMPAQAAHSIFNYLIGYIMFYVRTPCEGGQDAISGALSLLWLCIPSVEGIYFKDLKQTLKKEQCDPYLLVSASVASAKKILVHGPDLSSIPSQLPIHEDTQFFQILQESLEFFNIPEDQQDSHFLVDTKTHQIHSSTAFVRDFYFFRRNFYPQLSLVHMNPDDAKMALQRRVFMLKFVEVGKVLLTNSVMETSPAHQIQNHVSFLHEELSKLPSFPRKALETEFDMYSGNWGKEIFGMDSLHKYSWAKLMSTMFASMSSTFTWSNDLSLFINVLNGTIVLQFEDTSILRFCLATLINASRHFKHIFATNGFLYIMPTLLRVYSNNQPNPVLCKAIHFVCKQFYILHRKPFILQLFGSVAPILDMGGTPHDGKDCSKVQADSLFKLLLALEKYCPDQMSILDLVGGEKPLKALDFCYENDPLDAFNLMEVVTMCVTVIAYAPDSFRSGQMLTILQMVIPRYLEHAKKETSKRDNATAARAEIATITNLAISVRALVTCCESFTRNMSLPQRLLEATNNPGLKPLHNHSIHSLTVDDREDSHASRHMEEGRRRTHGHEPDDGELRDDFRKPRDSLLSICADFYTKCFARLKELRKILSDPAFRPPELLDYKAHNRLAEVAHTLLKLAPYDPVTMGCTGLQRYMLEILPSTDWSNELIRPGLNLILRRLDRLFTKVSKKSALRRQLDWEAAANILKGVYQTLRRFSFIALLPHLKTLVNVLITILLTTTGSGSLLPESLIIPTGSHRSEPSSLQTDASPVFVSVVVKLVAMQMQGLGDQYSLDQICGGVSVFCANEKSLNLLINFILPLCIRVGSNCRDTPRMSQNDVTFVLTVIVNLLSPSCPTPSNQNSASKSNYLSIGEYGRSGSVTNTEKWGGKLSTDLHHYTALVGLEILMVCFDKQLSSEWHQVAKCIQNLATRGKVDLPLWKFLDFLVTHRPSLFVLLQTFIQFRMLKVNCDTAQEYYLQQTIKDKLQGYTFSYHKSASAILVSLAIELRQLRDELANSCASGYRSRAATFATDHSDYSQNQIPIPERLPNASITEIATEIIGPIKASRPSLTKRSSRATLFSQSSSTISAPLRTQATLQSSEDSPSIQNIKGSKRITARDGSRILDKFSHKSGSNEDGGDIMSPHSPILHRHGTLRFRGNLSKQNSLDVEHPVAEVVYECSDLETANGRAGAVMEGPVAEGYSATDDPKGHRLQRQDAKSRKTFKIKRAKTKTSVRPRFMSHRRRPDFYTLDGERGDTGEDGLTRTAVVFHEKGNNPFQLRRHGPSSMTRSVETIPESVEVKTSRARFLQRSKSHDEPQEKPPIQGEKHHGAQFIPGRFHRQGGRMVHSRSPSASPSVTPQGSFKKQHIHMRSHTYDSPSGRDSPVHRSHITGQVLSPNRANLSDLQNSTLPGPMKMDHDQRCPAREDDNIPMITYDKNNKQQTSPDSSSRQMMTSTMYKDNRNYKSGDYATSLSRQQQNSRNNMSLPLFDSPSHRARDKSSERADSSRTGNAEGVGLVKSNKGPPFTRNISDPLSHHLQSPAGLNVGSSPIPTRRHAMRGQARRGHGGSLSTPDSTEKTGPPFSSALDQIKGYASPGESPADVDKRFFGDQKSRSLDIQGYHSLTRDTKIEPELFMQNEATKSSQMSPLGSPTRKGSFSGSSSQTSPSHVTSFSSTPNDSPVRKPSFSSSLTSPTRKVSYSSSSTVDSPTHKLFLTYRNTPAYRSGYTSPHEARKTSFSSSSYGSPVRKPSFSSSSESRNRPTYSSTTSSQSSIFSSPTHVPGKPYSSISPTSSPSKSASSTPLLGRNRGGNLTPSTPSPTQEAAIVPQTKTPASQHSQTRSGLGTFERNSSLVSSSSSRTLTPDEKSPQYSTFPTKFNMPGTAASTTPTKPSSLNLAHDNRQKSPQPKSTEYYTSSDLNRNQFGGARSYKNQSQSPSHPRGSGVRGLISTFDKKSSRTGGPKAVDQSPAFESRSQSHDNFAQSSRFSPPDYSYNNPPVSFRSSREAIASPTYHHGHQFSPSRGQGSSGASRSSSYQSQILTGGMDDHSLTPSPLTSANVGGSDTSRMARQRTYQYQYNPEQVNLDKSSSHSSVYVSRCDSSDSLSANESSSLLRDEEKSQSYSSLYYADEDVPGPI